MIFAKLKICLGERKRVQNRKDRRVRKNKTQIIVLRKGYKKIVLKSVYNVDVNKTNKKTIRFHAQNLSNFVACSCSGIVTERRV